MRLLLLFLLPMVFTLNAMADSTPSTEKTIPPLLMEIARCDAVTEDPNDGKVSFDIYISVDAMDQNNSSLKKMPGVIVQTGVPFWGDIKVMYTTAQVMISALDIQPIKFKAQVGEDSHDSIILKADLFGVDGSFTGSGMVKLGAMGSVPLKCTLGDLRTMKLQ